MPYATATVIGLLMVLATCIARADTVTDWNQTAIEVMKVANSAGNPWSRTLAMVHVAMGPAVAGAVRHILAQLYPNQKALIEEAYAASLQVVPDRAAKHAGVALG